MSGQPMTAAMLMMTVIIILDWKDDEVGEAGGTYIEHTDGVLVGKPGELGILCVRGDNIKVEYKKWD